MDLKTRLVSIEDELSRINQRLASPSISDSSYRALLKTKNDLIAEKQDLEIRIDAAQRQFNRSLNEGIEL